MPIIGKHYDKPYKIQIVKLVVDGGRKPKELAEEVGVSVGTLRNWISVYRNQKEDGFVGSGNVPSGLEDQCELENRIKDLEEENAILNDHLLKQVDLDIPLC